MHSVSMHSAIDCMGPGLVSWLPPWAGDTGPRDARPGGGGGAAEGTEGIA